MTLLQLILITPLIWLIFGNLIWFINKDFENYWVAINALCFTLATIALLLTFIK